MSNADKCHNLKIIVAYDGTNYKGWQKTDCGFSIEETLEKAISIVLQHPVELQAASRTDAGVHALGQVVNFFTPHQINDTSQLPVRFNQLLPKDISVLNCQIERDDFHPTTWAKSKEYRYFVCLGPIQLPHNRLYSWHCVKKPTLEVMRMAANGLVGRHDFSSFCNFHINSRYEDFTREVESIEIIEIDTDRLCFIIKGSNFLYKMVRNLVGTIMQIGQAKIPLETLPQILAAKDRRTAGITAPAQGLFLQSINYL